MPAKERNRSIDILRAIGRKIKNLIVPLIGWNIVYAAIVSLINLWQIFFDKKKQKMLAYFK